MLKKILISLCFLGLVLFSLPVNAAEKESSSFFLFDWIGRAIDYIGNAQVRSRESDTSQKYAPGTAWFLDPPSDIDYSFPDDSTVVVTWTPPFINNQLFGYNVYRREEGQTSFHKRNKEVLEKLDFQDEINAGVSYEYFVVSVTEEGLQSLASEYIFARYDVPGKAGQIAGTIDRRLVATKTYDEPEITETDEGVEVKMAGLVSDGKLGEPVLPVDSVKFLIPPNMDVVNVTFENLDKQLIGGGYDVVYQQPNYPINPIKYDVLIPTVNKNTRVYTSTEEYPKKALVKHSIQKMNGYTLLLVTVFPVKYTPAIKRLEYIRSLDVVVELKWKSNVGAASLSIQNYRRLSKDKDRVLDAVVNDEDILSYQSIPAYKSTAFSSQSLVNQGEQVDYVVICPNSFKAAFQPLIDRKLSKGVQARIVTLEEISANYGGTSAANIKSFISDAYQNWGTIWVLLGGDVQFIPPKGTSATVGYTTDNNLLTDLYYGCLDGDAGNDLYAEVYVGRVPADNVTHVTNWVNKWIAFNELPKSDPFFQKHGLYGERLDSSTMGGWSMNRLSSLFIPDSYSFLKRYDMSGGWSAGTLRNDINSNGQYFIHHLGHSNVTYAMKSYSSIMSQLTNTKYPIIYSQGCYPGSFDNRTTSYYGSSDAWAEVAINDDHGAVAVIMNSRYGWYRRGSDRGLSQIYHEKFVDEIYQNNIREIAKANQISKEKLIGTWSYYKWVHFETNVFGDPQLLIPNNIIQELGVSFLSVYSAWNGGELSFPVSISGGEGTPNSYTLQISTDGQNWSDVGTDTDLPFTISWDSRTFEMQPNVRFRALVSTDMGETATSAELTLNIDNLPPGTFHSGQTGWSSDPVSITLIPQDSGSGVQSIYYTTDGSTPDASSRLYVQPLYFTASGRYFVKFFSVDKVGNVQPVQSLEAITIDTELQPGWPHQTSGAIYGAPTIANIDNEPDLEVLFGSNDGKLHVLKADGTPALGWPKKGYTGGASSPAVGDIDGDGDKEIIVGGAYSGILAYHHDGTPVDGWPIKNTINKPFSSSPALGDVDNNGIMDIIIGALGEVYVYDAQGNLLPGWPNSVGLAGEDMFSSPSVGDLDGDGDLEIAIGSRGENSAIYVWHHDGTPAQGWPRATTSVWIASSPVFGNIDVDPEMEIIIGGGGLDINGTLHNKLYAFNFDGSDVSGFPFTAQGGNFPFTPALADIDADGELEIIIGNLDPFNNKLYAINGNGSVVQNFPVALDHRVFTAAVVGDIDGDEDFEIIYGSDNNQLYAIHHDGSSVEGFPRTIDGTIGLSPAITDLDQDGNLEIMAGSWDHNIYVWNMESPYNSRFIPWAMFKHDLYHTGMYYSLTLLAPETDKKQGREIYFEVNPHTNDGFINHMKYEYSLDAGNTFSDMGIAEQNYPYRLEWNNSFLTNLNQEVVFRVYFVDKNDNQSPPVIFRLYVDNKAPRLPSPFSAVDTPNDNGESISLSWTKSADDGSGDRDVQFYALYRFTEEVDTDFNNTNRFADNLITTLNAGVQSYTDSTATKNTDYYYAIGVSDGSNEIVSPQTIAVQAVDNTAPANVSNFKVEDVAEDQGGALVISFTRSASEQNEDITYEIFKGTQSTTMESLLVTTANTISDAECPQGTSFYYQVKTSDGTNTVASSILGPVQSIDNIGPEAPLSVTVQPLVTATPNFLITWTLSNDDPVAGKAGSQNDVREYRIYRDAGVGETLVATLVNGNTMYEDYDVAAFTNYWYRVSARDSNNESFSEKVGPEQFTDPLPPGSATSLTAADRPNDQGNTIILNWTKSPDDGAGANDVVSYWIYRTGNINLSGNKIGQVAAGIQTYNDTSAMDGVSYTYRIFTFDAYGNQTISDWSNYAKSKDDLSPQTPTNFQVNDLTPDNGYVLQLNWTASPAPDVETYDIYQSDIEDGPFVKSDSIAGYLTTATVNVAQNNKTYYFQLLANDGSNLSNPSAAQAVQAIDNNAPAAVTGFSVSDILNDQDGKLSLNWTRSADDGKGAQDVIHYEIYRSQSENSGFTKFLDLSAGSQAYLDATVTLDTTYYYYINTYDGTYRTKSAVVSAKAVDNFAASPQTITATDVANDNGGEIRGTFSASPDEAGKGDIVTYQIYRSHKDDSTVFSLVGETGLGTTSYVDTTAGLDGWYYKVVAVDSVGNQGSSTVVGPVFGLDNIFPEAPRDISAIDTPDDQGGSITLSWIRSSSSDVVKYVIQRSELPSDTIDEIADVPSTNANYVNVNLDSGTGFYYRVYAVDKGGNKSYSSWSQKTYPIDNMPPATPQNVTASDYENDNGYALKASWIASVDDHEDGDVVLYEVFTSESRNNGYSFAATANSGLEFAETPVAANGQLYYLKVRAYDGTNYSDFSSPASGKSIDNLPPENVKRFSASDFAVDQKPEILLTWDLSSDDTVSGDVQEYQVYRSEPPDSGFVKIVSVSKGIGEYLDSNASLGVTYNYYLMISDSVNQTKSNIVQSQARDLYAAAPRNIVVKDRPNDHGRVIMFSWDDSPDESGRGDIVRYDILRRSVDSNGTPEIIGSASLNENTYEDLTAGYSIWTYFVEAVDEAGNYSNGNAFSPIQSKRDILPEAPVFTVVDLANDQGTILRANWNKTDDAAANNFDLYSIEQRLVSETSFEQIVTLNPEITGFDIEGLSANESYIFRIVAIDGPYRTESQVVGPISPVDNLPPLEMRAMTAEDVPEDSGFMVNLKFFTSPDDGANADDVQNYILEYATSVDGPWIAGTTVNALNQPDTETQAAIRIPENNQLYHFRVMASDGTNQTASVVDSAQAIDDILDPPTGFVAEDVPLDQGGKISLNWVSSEDNGTAGRLMISQYQLYRAPAGTEDYILLATLGDSEISYLDDTCEKGGRYAYKIHSIANINGSLMQSPPVLSETVEAMDNIPPEPASQLTAADNPEDNGNGILLNWSLSPSDHPLNVDVVSYVIYRSMDELSGYQAVGTVNSQSTQWVDTSVSNNRTYYYKIAAADTRNESELSRYVSASAHDNIKPAEPQFLIVQDTPEDNGASVDLIWKVESSSSQSTEDIIGMKLLRSLQANTGFEVVADLNPSATSYSDKGLLNMVNYYYRLQVTDGTYDVNSVVYGPVFSRDNLAPADPIAVDGYDRADDYGNAVIINWTLSPEDDPETDLVSHYELFIEKNSGPELVATANKQETSSVVLVPENKKEYTVVVKAADDSGLLSAGQRKVTVTAFRNKVHAPTNVVAADVPDDLGNAIQLTWVKSVDDTQNSDLVRYEVFRKQGGDYTLIRQLPVGSESFVDSTVVKNTVYTYQVKVLDDSNNTAYAESNAVVAKNNLEPNKLTDLIVTDHSADNGEGLDISFGQNDTNNGRTGLTYIVERKNNVDSQVYEVGRYTSIPVQDSVVGLTKERSYQFRVNIMYSGGLVVGDFSPAVTPQDNSAPAAPADFVAQDVPNDNGYKVRLSWTKSPDDSNVGDVLSYNIFRRSELESNWNQVASVSLGFEETIDTVPTNNLLFYYVISASDGTFETRLGVTPSVQALDTIAPSSVEEFSGSDVPEDRGGAIKLSWTRSSDDSEDGDLKFYIISRKLTASAEPFEKLDKVYAGSTEYIDAPVSDNVNYSYKLSVSDGLNEDVGIDIHNISAQHNHPKSGPPSNLSATDKAPDQGGVIQLTWTKSVDDGGRYDEVIGYKLSRSLAEVGPFELLAELPKGTESYQDTGLVNGTRYFYKLTAVNTGTESDAIQADVIPLDNIVPKQPINFVVGDTSDDLGNSVSMNWVKSSDDGEGADDVVVYKLYRANSLEGPYTQLASFVPGTENHMDSTTQMFKKYFYKLTVTDSSNESSGEVVGPVVAYPDVKLEAGQHFLSIPFTVGEKDTIPATLDLPEDRFSVYYWDSDQSKRKEMYYSTYPQIQKFELGRGYIADVKEDTRIVATAGSLTPTANYSVQLKPYWNMVGCPFLFKVDVASLLVKYNNVEFTFQDAVNQGLIQNTVWGYATNGFIESSVLEPFKGYWMLAFKPVELIIPPIPSQGVQTASLRTSKIGSLSKNAEQFQLQLNLSTKSMDRLDRDNFIGALSTASNGLDSQDTPEPPMLRDYIQLYFVNKDFKQGTYQGEKYSADIREQVRNQESWVFKVASDQNRDDLVLRINGLDTLDDNYQISLFDVNAQKSTAINKMNSKVTVAAGGEYRLSVINTASLDTFRISDVYNYPNPFNPRNTDTKIHYELTHSASGTITIYSISGIKVKTITIESGAEGGSQGLNEVVWDGTDFSGDHLSNGAYFYHIKLTADNNQTDMEKGKMVIWK